MIDEKAIKSEARLLAIEYFIGESFRMNYVMMGASAEDTRKSHDHMREHLQTMKMPRGDPAISDLAASELQEAFGRLLDRISESALGQRT